MGGNENYRPDNDYELVSRCKKGDLDAFEALVIKHQGKMLNFAFRMVGNYEDACEIVQDSFLSAYKAIQQFEGRSSFSTWLCSIVINTSRNRIRQIKASSGHEQFSLDEPVSTEDGSMRTELAADCPSVLDQLEKKEIKAGVQKCINTLESEFREVLILRDIQGFSYDEISAMLKVAQGTVKSRLFRAREYMKRCLMKAPGE